MSPITPSDVLQPTTTTLPPNSQGFPQTGTSYISRLEHEYLSLQKLTVCSSCLALAFQRPEPLKRCNGCHLVDYCSRACQKAHWRAHKAFCHMVQGHGARNGYLSACGGPEEVFRRVVDSYRVRVEGDYAHRGEGHGVYSTNGGEGLPTGSVWVRDGGAVEDFQRYLDLCEESGVLPEWWGFESRMECLAEAVDRESEEVIFNKIDQDKLVTRYGGDVSIRNALAVLAELVVGYDGTGRAKGGKWFAEFQEYFDLNSAERARLIQGTVEAVKSAGVLPGTGTEG